MSYKITFDEKAKEIIKTVVNNGDTPTPTEGSCKPAFLAPGHYKFYADRLLEVLIAKNIDVDAEIESSWYASGLTFALAFNNNNTAFTDRADYFGLSTFPDSGIHCELRIGNYYIPTIYFSEDPEVLTYKAILTEISKQYSKGIDVYIDSYGTYTYIPLIGLQTGSHTATDGYSLTNAEFDTILKYIDEAEYPSEA